MSEANSPQSQPTSNPTRAAGAWTSAQAYILAAFCLLLGVALGYLFRGSASVAPAQAAASTSMQQGSATQPPDPKAQAALAQAAAPLLEAVNKNPNDFDLLVKLGNLYYDGQQFPRRSSSTSARWRFILKIRMCGPTWGRPTGTRGTRTKPCPQWNRL